MRRFDDRPLWGFWLLTLLLGAWVAQLADFRPNDVDTGVRSVTPSFEPSRLFDDSYYNEVNDWIESEFALRGAGLRARAAVDYELFGDSAAPGVVEVGRGDWLFWSAYLDPDCEALDEVVPPTMPGADVARFLVTSPKAAYHADRLREPESVCVAEARAGLVDRFGGLTREVDRALAALVEQGIEVFMLDDTHWSTEARLAVARSMVEALAPGRWDDDAVTEGQVPRLSGLARAQGIAYSGTVEGPVTTLDVHVVSDQYVALNGDLLILQHSESGAPDPLPGVTYIIGDSQTSYTIPLIAPYFEDLRFVNWFLVEGFGFTGPDWPPPDRILVQMIEDNTHLLETPELASFLARLDSAVGD